MPIYGRAESLNLAAAAAVCLYASARPRQRTGRAPGDVTGPAAEPERAVTCREQSGPGDCRAASRRR